MSINLYNTLSRSKESFVPPLSGPIRLFVCGPTVYGHIHVGNARTAIFFDLFAKFLRKEGHEVDYLQNITDVDDKIITKAKEEKRAPEEVAIEYEKAYHSVMSALGVNAVSHYERATAAIPEIISQITRLIEREHAYSIKGDVYFSVSSFPEYGKLSHQDVSKLQSGETMTTGKRDPHDFTLWKAHKEGEPFWDSPWGKGRPGWHIEDTALAEKFLGPQYDIHGGGLDIIFPHHEAEVAQAEAVSGKAPYVRYWMHTGLLAMDGEKMSKSLGNIITVHDLLQKYSAATIRMAFLSAHYRSPLDYSDALFAQAEENLTRIKECIARLQKYSSGDKNEAHLTPSARTEWLDALRDDMNTPVAFATLFNLVREVNKKIDEKAPFDSRDVLGFFEEVEVLFSIGLFEHDAIPAVLLALAQKRETARQSKNWAESDILRAEIEKLGYSIKDTEAGPVVRKS